MPVVTGSVSVGVIWTWILNGDFGLLNSVLAVFGINGPKWLTDTHMVLLSIVIVSVWWNVGYNMVLLLAGLQNIPEVYYEAAEIDGCTNFKFLYTIGVPLIKPSLGALIIYVFLQSWNYYLWPLLVTDSVNMRTVQIGLGMLQGAEATDFRPVMAGAMVILIPSILVFIIGQKQMISGLTAGAVKG